MVDLIRTNAALITLIAADIAARPGRDYSRKTDKFQNPGYNEEATFFKVPTSHGIHCSSIPSGVMCQAGSAENDTPIGDLSLLKRAIGRIYIYC